MTTNTNPNKTVWLIQSVNYDEDSDGAAEPLAIAVDRDAAESRLVGEIEDLGDLICEDRKAYDGGEVLEHPVPSRPDLTRLVWSHDELPGLEIWVQEFDLVGGA
jgi:hypothetical protein